MAPIIRSFPDDTQRRIVWWYGPIIKNPYQSEVPLAEILTRTIEPNGHLSKQAHVRKVPISELDIVKIGSIWQGRSRIELFWEPTERQQFSFDFSIHSPESIRFNDNRSGKDQYYITTKAYWLGEIVNGNKYHFFNSTLTKLQSIGDVTILIPALEFLTGAVSPAHKQIRYQLVQQPLDQLTDRYIKEAYVKDNRYVIRAKVNHYDENFALLAYLRLNQISRSRLSRLWPSVEKTNLMPNGKPYEDRYPEVLPYHPTSMSLGGDGIWIDDRTFLMLRITAVSSPQDYTINPIKTIYISNPTDNQKPDNDGPNYNPDVVDSDELEIDEENDSNWSSGVSYIRSGVRLIGPSSPMTETIEEKENNEPRLPQNQDDQDATGLSSGEPNNREDSAGNATLKQDHLEYNDIPSLDSGNIMKDTIATLNRLIDDEASKVIGFTYINQKGYESQKTVYCHFSKKMMKEKIKGQWHITKKVKIEGKRIPSYTFRNFLIIKITVNDNNNIKSAYLLEIERRSESEAFAGLLFNFSGEDIITTSLTNLLFSIVNYKGRYSINTGDGTATLELPVDHHLVFKHVKTDTSLKNAITKGIRNGLFLL